MMAAMLAVMLVLVLVLVALLVRPMFLITRVQWISFLCLGDVSSQCYGYIVLNVFSHMIVRRTTSVHMVSELRDITSYDFVWF